MSLGVMIFFVLTLGGLGGVARSLIGDGFRGWRYDESSKILTLGTLGDVLAGAIAALVVWGLYGPNAGQAVALGTAYSVTFGQCSGSLLLGISGAQVLKLLSDRHAESVTKVKLVETAQKLLKRVKELENK